MEAVARARGVAGSSRIGRDSAGCSRGAEARSQIDGSINTVRLSQVSTAIGKGVRQGVSGGARRDGERGERAGAGRTTDEVEFGAWRARFRLIGGGELGSTDDAGKQLSGSRRSAVCMRRGLADSPVEKGTGREGGQGVVEGSEKGRRGGRRGEEGKRGTMPRASTRPTLIGPLACCNVPCRQTGACPVWSGLFIGWPGRGRRRRDRGSRLRGEGRGWKGEGKTALRNPSRLVPTSMLVGTVHSTTFDVGGPSIDQVQEIGRPDCLPWPRHGRCLCPVSACCVVARRGSKSGLSEFHSRPAQWGQFPCP